MPIFLIFLAITCCFSVEASLAQKRKHSHQETSLRGSANTDNQLASNEDSDDDDDDDDEKAQSVGAKTGHLQYNIASKDEDNDDNDEKAQPAGPKTGHLQYSIASKKEDKKDDNDDDEDDDDDDDDKDDEKSKPAGKSSKELAEEEDEVEKKLSPGAAEIARLTKKEKSVQNELDENQEKQFNLKTTIDHLSDEAQSDREIDSQAKLLANETQSPAMAAMMGDMWKEMRMFEMPFYADHVQEEIHNLKQDENKLETQLKSVHEELRTAKEKDEAAKKSEEEQKKNKDVKEEEKGKVAKESDGEKEPAKKKKSAIVQADDEILEVENELPTWSFWSMTGKQQKGALLGSSVYLVCGILLAYIYKKLCALYTNLSTPKVRPDIHVDLNSSHFTFSLFGCFGDPTICVMGCLFPSMRWADTLAQKRLMTYWKAFFTFFILVTLHIYTFGISSCVLLGIGVYYRQQLRKRYQIESGTATTVAMDGLAWFCCFPCAIIQEARESGVSSRASVHERH